MVRRRGWNKGQWLVRDEESGLIAYGKDVVRDYYGVLKRKDQADSVHPQQFVRAKEDPYMQYPQSDPSYVYDTSAYNVSAYVYGTNIPSAYGPAAHLFFQPAGMAGTDPGIGDMAVGTTFVVR